MNQSYFEQHFPHTHCAIINSQLHLCSVVGIMLNIYIVLLASVLVVIASLFLQYDATLSYSIVGCLIFVSTTAMLGILFVPKVSAFVIFETIIVRHQLFKCGDLDLETLLKALSIQFMNLLGISIRRYMNMKLYETFASSIKTSVC